MCCPEGRQASEKSCEAMMILVGRPLIGDEEIGAVSEVFQLGVA